MIDWSRSMQQTFEFYKVDPISWLNSDRINTITSAKIVRDSESDTLGSATLETTEEIDECYIRIYLVAIQNGVTERFPLATILCQAPSTSFDGKIKNLSMTGYTPLIELKETQPPVGFSLLENQNIMDNASSLMSEHMRGPVVSAKASNKLTSNFVSTTDDTWLSYVKDLISIPKYSLDLDAMGRTMFTPYVKLEAMRPIWTYTDDDSSILLPSITIDSDMYDVPNVVEIIYTNNLLKPIYAKVVNDNPNSPVSIVNRGREIVYREYNSSFSFIPTQSYITQYAKDVLAEKSKLKHTITYSHGYCPTRVGDCVLLNYKSAGLDNIRARVISQTIKCETGCTVEETAEYTTNLWEGK